MRWVGVAFGVADMTDARDAAGEDAGGGANATVGGALATVAGARSA